MISEQIAQKREDAFRVTLHHTIRVLLALTIPSAVLLSMVIRPVVAILDFDNNGTNLVVWVTRMFLVGMVGHALLETASRSFYAQQDARTPLITAGGNTLLFILLAVLLGFRLGAPGIALANSLAYSSQALVLLLLLNRKHQGILNVSGTLLRVGLGSLAGALLVYALLLLPLPALPLAVIALAAGGLLVLPFILPEIKLLINL
jgi:putative peptidoglycan lipid II flippase